MESITQVQSYCLYILQKAILNLHIKHYGSFYSISGRHFSVIIVVRVMFEPFSAGAYPSSLGRSRQKKSNVIFQLELSVLLVHSAVAMIHFKNSILQLKHYLSVMGTGILSIAKLKLYITLIKSTLNMRVHAHTRTHKQRPSLTRTCTHSNTKEQQTFLLCGADLFILNQKDSQSKNH